MPVAPFWPGDKAQHRAFREVAGNLRVTLTQFEELEAFARFVARLDDVTRARLSRGAAVRAALRQPERDPPPALSAALLRSHIFASVFRALAEAMVTENAAQDLIPRAR
ncbi:hypothetical protein [Vreelandella zhuhanensis]|uniref:hypothetical protein n=1 Tax=Vreelandella zhuhanensis TaxID=2684210 RepID=UPI001D1049C2|nr:hypothetical protein [Halomonas zhuhanensis]